MSAVPVTKSKPFSAETAENVSATSHSIPQLHCAAFSIAPPHFNSPVLPSLSLSMKVHVEKIWSVKALHHAETYFKLISSIDAKKMRLTKIDDDIYCEFKETFPEIDVENLQEIEQFKSDQAKDKWRNWIPKFEAKVQDFNYGTLLRNRAAEDYGPDNAFFGVYTFILSLISQVAVSDEVFAVTRIQFLAIEIARNKEGYNSIHSVKK
ncbi:hypothetical protein CcCBS67573_g08346 [Chytriomyces confervae]|uniref:Polysaccharide biosynthesis domain-containing protein n=1 Tax=Chytriomyces confervae TaxID=246404 RepID=A0A507ELL9_9FUNG|nr:hypothetical protein CcCBS67573_g08346 [Chytriomyces confervae]